MEDARGNVNERLEEGDGAELVSEGEDLLQGRERTLPQVDRTAREIGVSATGISIGSSSHVAGTPAFCQELGRRFGHRGLELAESLGAFKLGENPRSSKRSEDLEILN